MPLYRVIPSGDVLVVDGQVQVTATLGEYVRTKLRQRFRFFLGEWYRDQRQGIPYFRDVLGKAPRLGIVRSLFRAVLTSTPGIATITRFELAFDKTTRRLGFDFAVTLVDGTTLVVAPAEDDFILDLAAA